MAHNLSQSITNCLYTYWINELIYVIKTHSSSSEIILELRIVSFIQEEITIRYISLITSLTNHINELEEEMITPPLRWSIQRVRFMFITYDVAWHTRQVVRYITENMIKTDSCTSDSKIYNHKRERLRTIDNSHYTICPPFILWNDILLSILILFYIKISFNLLLCVLMSISVDRHIETINILYYHHNPESMHHSRYFDNVYSQMDKR